MKRRILPFALILGSLAAVYACSSSDNATSSGGSPANPEGGPTSEGGPGNSEGGPIDPDSSTNPDAPVTPTTDPLQGTAAPKQVADALGYADGPQWWQDTLYVSRPLDGFLEKVDLSNGSVTEVAAFTGKYINGNSVDKNNALISAATAGIFRAAADGGVPTLITNSYFGDGGVKQFDTPNDLVQHPSGVIFVTDPGYGKDPVVPPPLTNHLISIFNDGGAVAVDDFPDSPRPNGIAITKDGATLYVGVNSPVLGTKPYIKKYTVSATGVLSAGTKFAELPNPTTAGPTNDEPDGMAVDDNGNVYVAWRLGVNVYKADGTRYGAEPSIALGTPNVPTNVGFGRADRKSLFITTTSGKIFETVLNVPGVLK